MTTSAPILWTPSSERIAEANITRFMRVISERNRLTCTDMQQLYEWSVTEPESFWQEVWEFCAVQSFCQSSVIIENPRQMPGARFFPEAEINFAQNLLQRRDDAPAISFWGESTVRRTLSYRELYQRVASLAAAMRSWGIKPGDRVAACIANAPEAIIAMLASTSIGAVWSSCSPDFGVTGIIDRFGQIEPSVLFASDGYYFKDQWQDCATKISETVRHIPSLRQVVVVPYEPSHSPKSALTLDSKIDSHQLDDLLVAHEPQLEFARLPFNHPLYIMFSSGTTGKPKCIVHSAGGVLIEHLKELVLHTDLKPTDRIFYQTTCGWMMWNWLVSSLSRGACVVLYDGFPLHRKGSILFDLAQEESVTIFGTNPKFLSLSEKSGLKPRETHNLSAVRTILSTGAPLTPENFDYVYRDLKQDVCLSSISGGTDIVGCFALGSPLLPVRRGELQTRSLGLKVEVFDASGKSLVGEKGELVCTAPFPSMPLSFWNDPEEKKYRSAYFNRYPGIWHHGDYVELLLHGGMVFHGRSDAVLNPGGVRIGSAEIYQQVESIPEILESVAIAQEWEGDVRIILFVKLKDGHTLTSQLKNRIRTTIRSNTSPFHVPKKIVAVSDIPRTRSGKIVELAIREVVHGRAVLNSEALANPEALELFRNIDALREP